MLLSGRDAFSAEETAAWSDIEDLLAAQLELNGQTRFSAHFYTGSKHAEQYLNPDGAPYLTFRKVFTEQIPRYSAPHTGEHALPQGLYTRSLELQGPTD